MYVIPVRSDDLSWSVSHVQHQSSAYLCVISEYSNGPFHCLASLYSPANPRRDTAPFKLSYHLWSKLFASLAWAKFLSDMNYHFRALLNHKSKEPTMEGPVAKPKPRQPTVGSNLMPQKTDWMLGIGEHIPLHTQCLGGDKELSDGLVRSTLIFWWWCGSE